MKGSNTYRFVTVNCHGGNIGGSVEVTWVSAVVVVVVVDALAAGSLLTWNNIKLIRI